MTILRLRTEVADGRGSLGRVAAAIASCRGTILGVDVHFLDGVRVADEFIIEFGEGGSAEELAIALRRAGGVIVGAQPLDEHSLVDPVARAIDLAAPLAQCGEDRALELCISRLIGAERVRFVDEIPPEPEALRRAADRAVPVVTRAGRGANGPWLLLMANEPGRWPRWLVIERTAPVFSSSEIAGVAAMLRLAAAAAPTLQVGLAPLAPTHVRRRPASFFRSGSRVRKPSLPAAS